MVGALLSFSVVLAVAFGAIAMHSQLASRQIHLNALRVDIDAAERDHQMLRLEVAELDTPEQVVSAAYRLGLVGATEVEFLPTASTVVPVAAGPSLPIAQ
jgi:cell division protein FtsL